MLREKKYLIYRRGGHLRAFRFSSSNSHYYFAKDNGIAERDVIETGLLIDGHISVLECKSTEHLAKSRHKSFDLNEYHNLRLAREVESRYSYAYAGLKEGD